MEKITTILAVIEKSDSGPTVLKKAVELARHFGARVDLLIADPELTPEFASRTAAMIHDEVELCGVAHESESLQQALVRCLHKGTPDLLVKAPAQALLDWTSPAHDRELAMACGIPVLLAGPRPWARPLRLVAPVDVSNREGVGIAPRVLHAAGFLALGCQGNLD